MPSVGEHGHSDAAQTAAAEDSCTPSLPPAPALLPTSSSLGPCPREPVTPTVGGPLAHQGSSAVHLPASLQGHAPLRVPSRNFAMPTLCPWAECWGLEITIIWADLRDSEGSVPDRPNKANTEIRQVLWIFFGFPLHVILTFTLWSIECHSIIFFKCTYLNQKRTLLPKTSNRDSTTQGCHKPSLRKDCSICKVATKHSTIKQHVPVVHACIRRTALTKDQIR